MEVVRCKECSLYETYITYYNPVQNEEWWTSKCKYWRRETDPEGFCHMGRKRRRTHESNEKRMDGGGNAR